MPGLWQQGQRCRWACCCAPDLKLPLQDLICHQPVFPRACQKRSHFSACRYPFRGRCCCGSAVFLSLFQPCPMKLSSEDELSPPHAERPEIESKSAAILSLDENRINARELHSPLLTHNKTLAQHHLPHMEKTLHTIVTLGPSCLKFC